MLSPPLKGKDKGGSPREKCPACLTLEDCRLLPLFSGAGGSISCTRMGAAAQEVVQAVQDFANNSNACSPRRESSHGIYRCRSSRYGKSNESHVCTVVLYV